MERSGLSGGVCGHLLARECYRATEVTGLDLPDAVRCLPEDMRGLSRSLQGILDRLDSSRVGVVSSWARFCLFLKIIIIAEMKTTEKSSK